MKQHTNTTTKKSTKINCVKVDAQHKTNEVSEHCMMPSGLDRDIVLHSLLIVSVLVNLFFLASYLVVGSDASAAHTVGSAIYNL